MKIKYLNLATSVFLLMVMISSPIHLVGAIFNDEVPPPQSEQSATVIEEVNPYFSIEHATLEDGTAISAYLINGPPKPPAGFEEERAASIVPISAASSLPNFPSFSWVFGCSAVSGAMIAAYYDRSGYPNMYAGPTNGGVYPLTDIYWPSWTDGVGDRYPNNPLVASRNEIDGRTTHGSIDNYWVSYESTSNDPYITNGWPLHTWSTAIGDFMKTSQSAYGNVDGSTAFYNYTDSTDKLTCANLENMTDPSGRRLSDRDGTYGRKLFYEARGYTVTECYNQVTDNTISGGFSFADYRAHIDAGHPVMINLTGHTVVGFGYSGDNILIRDTWDNNFNNSYSMPWGGSYLGMELQAVSIVRLSHVPSPPTGPTFTDVPITHWAYNWIERLYQAGITTGCNTHPLRFCPEEPVQRDQMALFILRGMYGGAYQPPGVDISTGFYDVPTWHWAAPWIKQLAAVRVTIGCGGGNYCPQDTVSRDQMALFILRGMHGGAYQPPPVGTSTGFHDVPTWHWAAPWIKQLAVEGITTGCGVGYYCPNDPVTRAQMAVFLVRAFIDRVPPPPPPDPPPPDPPPPPPSPIKNGDFEAGQDGSWTVYSLNAWDIIIQFQPGMAHSGDWGVWMGGDHGEIARLSQDVIIPANQYYLHFYYAIKSEDTCGYDYTRLKINNDTIEVFELCTPKQTSDWVHAVFDLSDYQNSQVTLMFEVFTDDIYLSSFYLDTISLTSSITAPLRNTDRVNHPFGMLMPQQAEWGTP